MNVKVENQPKSQALVTVEVEPERVAEAREETFRRVAREAVIPGFRKGKAPRALVERYMNPDRIQDDAESSLMDKVWQELRTGDLKDMAMYDNPQVKVAQHNPLVFEVLVTLQPKVELGDYKSLRIAPELVTVNDEDVTKTIDAMRDQQAQWQPVTHRPVREGDMVTIQAHGNMGDQPITIPEGYSVTVTERSAFLVPGFVMRLVDMEIGKEKEFAIEMPADAADKTLAGKSGAAFITVQEIKEKILPALDDEFAKSQNADTVDALKEKVHGDLMKQREEQARIRLENSILDGVAGISTVTFPEAIVDRQVENMIAERSDILGRQGIDLNLYLRITQSTMEQMRAEMRPNAEKRIRNFLLVEELGHIEGIVIEDSKVNAEIERIAGQQEDPAAARKAMSNDQVNESVRNQLFIKELFDRLIATITEGLEPVAHVEPSAEMPSITDSLTAEPASEAPAGAKAGDEDKPKLIIATH